MATIQIDDVLEAEAGKVLSSMGLSVEDFVRDTLTQIATSGQFEESARRRKAVDFAFGNVALEGFVIDPECMALADRFVDGEFDFAQFRQAVLAQIGVDLDEGK